MIKTKISAVTSVTYGLLSALIIAVIVGGLSAAGVGVENVFSAAGNSIAAGGGNSTPALTAAQQSQITNAAAEIAAGTASAACLQYMNNSANAARMVSNNATCLGPGYGIAPPALPIALEYNGGEYVETNGLIYASSDTGEALSPVSATIQAGSCTNIEYNDGKEYSVSWNSAEDCQTAGNLPNYLNAGTATVINNGNDVVCSGTADDPNWPWGNGPGNNQSATAPLGYLTPW